MTADIKQLVEHYDLFEQDIKLEKPLEEFTLFRPTFDEINAAIQRDAQKLLIPEVIQENILTVAEEARVARGLCQQIAIDTDSYTWLKERGFEAVQIAEGSEIPARRGKYEKYVIKVGKTAVRPLVTNEMVEDSRWDVIRRNLDMATKAMARLEDRVAMNAMIQGVPNGSAVSDGIGGIGEVVSNHYIQMGDSPTDGVLAWKSIVHGLSLLRLEHYVPDTLLIHPYQAIDLMTCEGDFIGANERAYMVLPESIRNSMQNGTVGSIAGLNVVVSSEMTAGYALMFDSSEYMVFAERRPITVEQYDDLLRDMQGIVMTQRFGVGPVNRDASVLLYGGRDNVFP
jgi:hypothetical protein